MATDELAWFFDRLKSGIPFAFGRFNDGEMGGIMNEGFVAARGDQRVGSDLREALKSALLHKQENYFVGIPCPLCFPKKYDATIDLIGGKDEHVKVGGESYKQELEKIYQCDRETPQRQKSVLGKW